MKGTFKMEPDFSGWATKAGLLCKDGRTIMAHAFKHQDKTQVPLVWQHGHTDVENVLGHVVLENREEGVFAHGYFNKSAKAIAAREALEHGDINSLSIWANEIVERSKRVLHGAIREVSLVLAGANPGATITNVTVRHSDDDDETLDDEVIIYSGLEIKHGAVDEKQIVIDDKKDVATDAQKAVYDSFTDAQKEVLHAMIADSIKGADSGTNGDLKEAITHASGDATVQEVYDSLSDLQKTLLHAMVGEAMSASPDSIEQSALSGDQKGTQNEMKHNIFEKDETAGKPTPVVISHSDVEKIVADAKQPNNTFKGAVTAYAIAHGIENIDLMFPDAQNLTNTPDFISRRMEWVNKLLTGVRKSPFSRIKTMTADITVQEARAKGYIKGNLKKEEFFGVARRTTTPQTIYKKQKLDRDDIIDITDFDVVVWLKGEMRIMLDEELARAILLGDGRAVDDEDKINETHIRPVATDHEVYTTTLTVAIDDGRDSISDAIDEIALHRSDLRGSGAPILWTTERYLARMLLLKDTTGRKIYKNVDELASDMRVSEIVTVEVMEEYPDIFGVLFNPTDYVVGADRGGQVSMFDDFDIDYNQYKYLIETRTCGALVKFKAAMVIRVVAAASTLAAPAAPTFDGTAVTIVNTPGVVYRNADTDVVMNAAGSPYAVPEGDTINVHATAADGYYFRDSDDDDWTFTNPA